MTVADVLAFLETIAPQYMKMDWDNVGLNCGRGDLKVTKILVALDPFAEVLREAKTMGAELVVTHHALIWDPGFVTDQSVWGRSVLFLLENGMAHINAHTNLDCAPGGVNDCLASILGLSDIQVINPSGTDGQGRPWGLLRCGTVEEQPVEAFLAAVKERLECRGLRYADGGKPVRKVAVGGGSCAGAIGEVLAAGCDTFVTADVKYNQFRDAYDLGLNLIDAGHFHTEYPVCRYLAESLQAAFPEIEVTLSRKVTDPMKFFG